MEFSEKDAADLAKLKQVMFDKAAEGDAHAATAFANLLNAETARSKTVAPVTQEEPATGPGRQASEPATPATEPKCWAGMFIPGRAEDMHPHSDTNLAPS